MHRPRTILALLLLLLLPAARALAAPPEPHEARAFVVVEGDGYVRVRAAELRALGFIDAQLLQAHGAQGAAPMVSAKVGDDIVFLALGTGANPHDRRGVYWLEPGDPEPAYPLELPNWDATGLSLPRDEALVDRTDARATLHDPLAAAEEAVYARQAPTWFRYRLAARGRLKLPIPPGTVPGSALTLRGRLHTTQPGGIVLAARHGSQTLTPSVSAEPDGSVVLRLTLENVDAQGTLELEDQTPAVAAPRNDVSDGRGNILISGLTWTGVVDVAQATGLLDFEHTHRLLALRGWPRVGWHAVAVDPEGRSLGAPAVRVSTDAAPLPGVPAGMAVFRGHRTGPGRVVLGPERTLAPQGPPATPGLPTPPDPLVLDGVEHLIVALPHLLPAAERLAAHRRAHGLKSLALSTAWLDPTGRGLVDPRLLRESLRAWGSLRYLLLVGDATFDRVDLSDKPTLPSLMARTQYNGATPADTLYVEDDGDPAVAPPVVGRLPFSDPATLDAFVTRLIAYETAPPRDASRRTLRFLASEGRFGPLADAMIEMFFKRIVGQSISPAYDVEVTFASQVSAFLWPPREFGAKVIESINQGALFYTYVGHGFAQGFDSLHVGEERYPILHLADAQAIDVKGTPPVMVAIACTTAQFDDPRAPGLGETLLARPHGPIAYIGATRICHPAGNAFLGRSIARAMFPAGGSSGAGQTRRLGEVLAAARREVLDPSRDDPNELRQLTAGTTALLPPGTTLGRLKHEAFWLYNLLGDPGTRLAVPERALEVSARRQGESVEVTVRGAADGETVEVTLELPRMKQHPFLPLARGLKAGDPTQAEAIRRNHAHANDKVVLRGSAKVERGIARVTLSPAPDTHGLGDPAYGGAFQVKASVLGSSDIGLGVTLLEWSPSSPDGPDAPR